MGTEPAFAFQTPEGGWRVVGSRVSLDSVVIAYQEGLEPEEIVGSYPSLSLGQVEGSIAFYLHHREEMDRYLARQEERWECLRQESEVRNDPLRSRLRTTGSNPANSSGSL